jgi:Xaa-Pro aminopeptidase
MVPPSMITERIYSPAVYQLVPAGEIERRLAAFQAVMRDHELDAAVLVQSVDLYYFTGTTQNAHLVVPADGEPVLLVRRTLERARAETPLERVEPLRSLRDLAGALEAAGVSGGRLGFELDVLPAVRYLDYAKRLSGFELADCSGPIRTLRSVKSPWELARIREAAAMLARVDECVAGVLREGMAEIELAAEVEAWLRRQGHQGVIRMRSFNGEVHYGTVSSGAAAAEPGGTDTPLVGVGPNPYVAKGPSFRPIERGVPVIVDALGSSCGYMADQTRTFSLGPVASHLKGAYDASVAIMRGVAGAARPGVTGASLWELSVELAGERRDHFASAGRISFVAHGFGLEIDEPPFLARAYDVPLAEGMVFALEPKFVYEGEGAVGIENSYAVTAGGVERLTTAPEELIEL